MSPVSISEENITNYCGSSPEVEEVEPASKRKKADNLDEDSEAWHIAPARHGRLLDGTPQDIPEVGDP